MPSRRSARRVLGALALVAAVTLTSLPHPALGFDPPRPLPGYHPTFVTERQSGKWEDCTWAAAAMLLDKWTNGATVVDRERLRRLSGDLVGGSGLAHVDRAFAKLGFALTWSPKGGDSVTWPELLDRLRHGGGAILLGDYHKLPRKYGRWDPSFWKNTGLLDDHALYLDGYDRGTGKVLVMDPLAPRGWTGEWIPVAALKKFAWRAPGGALWTALTPAALPAPMTGVTLDSPVTTTDGATLQVRWPVASAPDAWTHPGVTVTAAIEAVPDPDPADTLVAAQPAFVPAGDLVAPAAASATVGDAALSATIPMPAPGVHAVTVTVSETRFGRAVATGGPFIVYVPGPRAASTTVPAGVRGPAGATIAIRVGVLNSGTESWTSAPPARWAPFEPRNTRLVGTWVREPSDADHDRGLPDVPPPVDLGPLALEPGEGISIEQDLDLPAEPGTWHLILDVVDDDIGSFAATGSAPGNLVLEVYAPSEIVTGR